MWYVLRCPDGQEDTMIHFCRMQLPQDVLKDAFQFTYARMRRYEGQWHREIKPLFPGYIFLESNEGQCLVWKGGRAMESSLEQKSREFCRRIDPGEEELLQKLCGIDHHMDMSRGIIKDGITCVTEGPLKGKEALIRKIDRHKRLAMLDLSWLHRPADVWTGLEIVSKS